MALDSFALLAKIKRNAGKPPSGRERAFPKSPPFRFAGLLTQPAPLSLRDISPRRGESPSQRGPKSRRNFRAIPHNSKCRYGERGAADAKPKAQIILCAAKVSAAGGGNSEPKQGQRSQSARGFCSRCTMRVPQPDIIEHFGNADAVLQPPERCLSRKAGIVRCCLRNTCKIYLRNRNTFCPALRYNKIRFQPFKEGTTQPWQK